MRLATVLLTVFLLAPVVRAAGEGGGEAGEGRPWRVLIVHSFGSNAPPFTVHSTAFESAIKRELGAARVDLDHASLENARYAQPDLEEAFAEFLARRVAVWKPDLVVPIAAPAGRFVAKYRDRLFPGTPVLYSGLDRRTMPEGAFAENAAFVGERLDILGLVEDALRLDPATNHVVVIFGSTPLERLWTAEFRKVLAPLEPRVRFTYANDLTCEQILELASGLGPHSFVLLGLLLRDAAGVTYNQDELLGRLRAASAAPVGGLFAHQVGRGIVGGRLVQTEVTGAAAARVAARILRGEGASGIPAWVTPTGGPTYDWRELRRWGIDEGRLPAGSVVLFREPAVWERYRWPIAGAGVVMAAQAALIFALVVQRRRRQAAEVARRRAEEEAHQRRAELAHVSRVATLGELTAALAHEISQPLTAIRSNCAAGVAFLDAPRPDLGEVRGALVDIREDCTRAGEVVRRVRNILKRGAPGFSGLDLNEVVRTVERIVRQDAALQGVAVNLELSDGRIEVVGDDVQLQQVLLNLMLNAFDAMGDLRPGRDGGGGRDGSRRVTVRTSRVDDGSSAVVEVRDEGTGIAPDGLVSIFEPFVSTKRDGLGMGLSICRTIVERHGGRIWATNNADRGATFWVALPLSGGRQSGVTPAVSGAEGDGNQSGRWSEK